MSHRSNQCSNMDDEMYIEVKHVSNLAEDNKLEEKSATTTKGNYEMEVQHVIIKEEDLDVDSEGEECYIFADADDMELVEIDGNFPYLRAALAVENPDSENGSHYVLVSPPSSSRVFDAGSNYSDLVNSDSQSSFFTELRASREEGDSKLHKSRLSFREPLENTVSEGTVGNRSNDYDSEIVIYPVENNVPNIEEKRMSLDNTSRFRKTDTNKGNNQPFQVNRRPSSILKQAWEKIIPSKEEKETHPFKCEECGESFELKSRLVMHELGHEKYKLYSARSNTVKCICIECKQPYLFSAYNKELNYSNMCLSCVTKLRQRRTLCKTNIKKEIRVKEPSKSICTNCTKPFFSSANDREPNSSPCLSCVVKLDADKKKENGVKQLLEFSGINNMPTCNKRKQCYSCGRRSNRYFVYGASLLCSLCWQGRIHKARTCTSLEHEPHQMYNSASSTYRENCPSKSQVPHFQYKHAEESPNLIGRHFLASAFDATGVSQNDDNDDDDDDDFQEFEEEWKETGILEYEEESDTNTVILCDKTGEFIEIIR